ncbi:MAG: hypothetical protein M3R10_00185 [Verrucomicrobiota bacterium]|nr:hypothetical protein [Verrucomicrobiota bacterium]
MAATAEQQWFLRKHEDRTVFGPLSFDQLSRWASSAQVASHDSISIDQTNWMKAPMLPELGMDWIVEVTSERFYGPTTLGSIREFLRLGEIDDDTPIINACEATRQQIRDIAPLLEQLPEDIEPAADETFTEPATTGMSIAVQDRIRELEQALREERRALAESEERYRAVEMKYNELINAAAAAKP